MDSLPILVPFVAGIVLCPTVILCMCLRRLQRRMDAVEGMVHAPPRPATPTPTGFLGGVTYGAMAPPLPSAPVPVPTYPYFTQPQPQPHPVPYALQNQRQVV